jgi:beta-galactosidase
MKKIIFYITVLFIQNAFCQNDWENPEMFQQNREKARASFYPYSTLEKALNDKPEDENFIKCLNGKWKFHFMDHSDQGISGFEKMRFDDSSWDEIPVPGNWEMYALHQYNISFRKKSAIYKSFTKFCGILYHIF